MTLLGHKIGQNADMTAIRTIDLKSSGCQLPPSPYPVSVKIQQDKEVIFGWNTL